MNHSSEKPSAVQRLTIEMKNYFIIWYPSFGCNLTPTIRAHSFELIVDGSEEKKREPLDSHRR